MKLAIILASLISFSVHAKLQKVCTHGNDEGWPRTLAVDIEPFNKAIVIQEGMKQHRDEIAGTEKQNDPQTLTSGALMIGEKKPLQDVTVYMLKSRSEIIESDNFVRLISHDGVIYYGFGHDQSGFYSSIWCK